MSLHFTQVQSVNLIPKHILNLSTSLNSNNTLVQVTWTTESASKLIPTFLLHPSNYFLRYLIDNIISLFNSLLPSHIVRMKTRDFGPQPSKIPRRYLALFSSSHQSYWSFLLSNTFQLMPDFWILHMLSSLPVAICHQMFICSTSLNYLDLMCNATSSKSSFLIIQPEVIFPLPESLLSHYHVLLSGQYLSQTEVILFIYLIA